MAPACASVTPWSSSIPGASEKGRRPGWDRDGCRCPALGTTGSARVSAGCGGGGSRDLWFKQRVRVALAAL